MIKAISRKAYDSCAPVLRCSGSKSDSESGSQITVHHGGNTALAIVLDLLLDGVQLMIEDVQEAVNVLALEIRGVGVLSCTTVRQAGGVASVRFTGLGEAERHALIRLLFTDPGKHSGPHDVRVALVLAGIARRFLRVGSGSIEKAVWPLRRLRSSYRS